MDVSAVGSNLGSSSLQQKDVLLWQATEVWSLWCRQSIFLFYWFQCLKITSDTSLYWSSPIMSRNMIKPTKWHMRPVATTQICLGICPVRSAFAVHMKKHWILSYPLSLRSAHRSFCWFWHVAALILIKLPNQIWQQPSFAIRHCVTDGY